MVVTSQLNVCLPIVVLTTYMEETVKKLSGEFWEGRLLHKLFQLIVLNATNVVVGILLAAQLLAVDDALEPLRA